MAKEKTVNVAGTEVKFRSSAGIPRMYRIMFKRDIFVDMKALAETAQKKGKGKSEDFDIEDLEIFENVAYCMAKHADPTIGTIDEWLDNFEMFSIYEILPEILDLWGDNLFATVENKKK